MKGILINPDNKSCTEVDYDSDSISDLCTLLECSHLDSRQVTPEETIIYGGDLKPDASHGFVIPLPKGSVRVMGKAIVVGVHGGRNRDTMLSATDIHRHLFWAGVDHAVS